MPSNITDFSSAENYQTAWIYHSIESTNPDASSANSGVPSALFSVANNIDTWSLVINGVLIGQGLRPQDGNVPYDTPLDGEWRVGNILQEKIYIKEDVQSTTVTVTTDGAIEPSPAGGTLGHIIGLFGQETSAWISYNSTPTLGVTNPYWFGNGANDVAEPLTGKYGVIWNGVVVGLNQTAYGTDTDGRLTYTDSNNNVYTRMQRKRVHSSGYDIHNVQKQGPSVTGPVTDNTITRTTTIYKFYEVGEALAGEINTFTCKGFLILPSHILQRSINKAEGLVLKTGLDLSDSHIRVTSNRALADVEISKLKLTFGIEAQAIPITLEIGTDNVVIALNQVIDVSLGATSGTLNEGQVLQYDGEKWINAQTAVPSIGPEPNSPINGQLWFDDAVSGKLYMWNINTWVQITS